METASGIREASRSISRSLSTVLAFGFLAFGCGGNDLEGFAERQTNPMASPTLSFASPSSVSGGAASNVGIGSQSQIHTSFDIDESRIEQAVSELLAQAEAAGFELERLDTDVGLVYVSIAGTSPRLNLGAGERTDGNAVASVTLTG